MILCVLFFNVFLIFLLHCESDSWGEDIEGTETDESSEYDSEDGYGDDFIVDSDIDMYPSSAVPNSGVVIEEIVDDDKPENGDDQNKLLKKKKQVAKLKAKESKSLELAIVAKDETDLVESEDEDGFPISTADKDVFVSQKEDTEMKGGQQHKKTEKGKKKEKDIDHSARVKRKVDSADEDEPQDGKKKKKRNKLKENIKGESADASGNSNETNVTAPDEKHPEVVETTSNNSDVSYAKDENDGKLSNNDVLAEKKNKKKKKKKTKESEGEAAADQITSTAEKQNLSTTSEKKGKKQTETKPSQVRTFANGLVIEELLMGKPDGKRAAPGKKVSVKYIGKLQKDGKIFDSNVGRAPFKFRLGVGQVIKGWEVGLNGMRIGDKRRITVPPSMGYADKRVGTIPPNSWLVFDVELVDVDR
ncbi:unnamed protein product [Sphenostylis stenocarpa]|uniref:peptidylprolyl isomerase n=1 Tax=Sphenostylis stenocarpa TaxID=92480 RepID=A0AA86RSJ4_9FABA|nr:unnamed protein product [Sphenostylis stenocarpa]